MNPNKWRVRRSGWGSGWAVFRPGQRIFAMRVYPTWAEAIRAADCFAHGRVAHPHRIARPLLSRTLEY